MSAPSSSSSSSSLREGEVAPPRSINPPPSPRTTTMGESPTVPAAASTAVVPLASDETKKRALDEEGDSNDSNRRISKAAPKQLVSAISGGPTIRLAASAKTERVLALRYGRSRREAIAAAASSSSSSPTPQVQRGVSAAASLYWSEREKNFGTAQHHRLRLTHEESELLLNVQQHVWVFPHIADTPSSFGYLLDGTAPFPSTMSDESRWRCLFFLATCGISPLEGDNCQGVSSVSVVVIVPSPDADPSRMDQVGQNLGKLLSYLSLMPSVHVDDIHLVAIADEAAADNDDIHAVLEYFHESLGPKIRTKSHVHLVRSRAEAADVLEAHGTLKRETLPTRVGGNWTRQECSEFLIQLSRIVDEEASDDDDAEGNSKVEEEEVACVRDGSPTSEAADEAAVPPRASSGRPASASASAPTANNNTNTQEFIRKRNAVYARRKYARRKIEVEVLKEQRHDLERQKQRLQAQNRRLTGLLEHAELCVDRYLASGGVAGSGQGGGVGASHAALTVTHLLPPGSSASPFRGVGDNDAESKFSDPKDIGGGGRDTSAASASRRTRLLLMEQLRLQDQLASSSSTSTSAVAATVPESSTASSSRRYLESLHGYPSTSSAYGGRSDPPRQQQQQQQQQPQRSVADAVVSSPTSDTAAAAREPRPRDNLSLQLALLHRQQQQQQDQQTMSALRAAAAAAPSHNHYPSQLLGDYRVVGSAHHGLLAGGGNSQHPNPSLVAELLWLQRDLELQNPNHHHHQLSPEERKSLPSPSPYPRNHHR